MSLTKPILLLAFALPLALHAPASLAQSPSEAGGIVACPDQNGLEQSINSAGSIMPEECTTLQLNSLTSDNGDLCLIDFSLDEGFIGQLRDAAFPSQWWVRCADLTAALPTAL